VTRRFRIRLNHSWTAFRRGPGVIENGRVPAAATEVPGGTDGLAYDAADRIGPTT
jgi:hypothetical protein